MDCGNNILQDASNKFLTIIIIQNSKNPSMSHSGSEQQIEVNYLRISADQKAFIQHKICFKQCIKNMAISTLDANETECVKNCLFKFNAVERLMIEKVRQLMQMEIAQSPQLRKAMMKKKPDAK